MEKDKTKVWIWNHYAIGMFYNRAGRHYSFAKYLTESGYDVTIFCASTRYGKNEITDIGDDLYLTKYTDGIKFVFVKSKPYKSNGLNRIRNMLSFAHNIKKVAKKVSERDGMPDVILASSVHPFTLISGLKTAKKFRIPCICEVRDLWPEAIFALGKAKENSLLGKTLVAGEHWIYKKADALIFTKEGDTDYIKENNWDTLHGGNIDLDKAHYINNGVDIESFNKYIKENIVVDEDLKSGKFNVIYTGAIGVVNNVGNILDTANLLKRDKDIQFIIYGAGNEKRMLEKRVENEDLDNVKIKGRVNRQFIPYVLSKSSINILNYSNTKYNWSRGNSSNKLFEYMASGKPIISTVKMGYSIIRKYKCGIELENSTPQELAQAIIEIKNMSEYEYNLLGTNAKIGANDFDFKILTRKLIDVINSVI